jgi:mRNA-degrading endonuclease RelE of RelBE toxin-antitoxin system
VSSRPAQQVYAREFDADFFRLSRRVQDAIERKIDELGRSLDRFPHERLRGVPEFRLRIGHYRVIYSFDIALNVLHLKLVGHRREVYREI